MPKKTNTPPNTARLMTITGVVMILSTPLIQPLYLLIARNECPLVEGERLCGLDPGIQIGMIGTFLPWLWLIIGVIYLLCGINSVRSSKKDS